MNAFVFLVVPIVIAVIGIVVLVHAWRNPGRVQLDTTRRELADARDRLELALDGLHAVRDEVQLQLDAQHPDLYLLRNQVQDALMKIATLNRKELNR